MNTDYRVGDLIYDANIYDGLNIFLSDLQFYKALGTPAKIYYKFEGNNTSGSHKLNSAVAQAGLRFQSQKTDTISVELITLHQC